MNALSLAIALSGFSAGALCDAHANTKAMRASIRPLAAGMKLAGLAKTVSTPAGQNRAIHRAVHAAAVGQVLVVDAGEDLTAGLFGDILGRACQQRGIAGLVIDGAVRDSAELLALGFPVFCAGVNPSSPGKASPGFVDAEISCGGVAVRPGDIVVGDGDGVVVIDQHCAQLTLERAQAVIAREHKIRCGIAEGRTPFEILNLTHD